MKTSTQPAPVLSFENEQAWAAWLAKHHATSTGVWLRLAKKSPAAQTLSHAQALEAALCQGWIDGQKKAGDDEHWLQRFTPRSARSIWSKVNRDKALALIDSGRMRAAGRKEVERARADGRWEQAYDSARTAAVPDDLQAALDRSSKARRFFATLDAANRYAILWRLQTAKKAETRSSRLDKFIGMLERGEKLHP
ncbi:MAG: putative periplasmic rane protein [Ramlibacter sp.]|nr:putative periplasmic rane protein [Ramlibacter sp.]